MPKLPVPLLHNPERKLTLREPKLYYGWIVDDSQMADYVNEHGIGADYEDEPEESGAEKCTSVNKLINSEIALEKISEELDLKHPPELAYVLNHETRKGAQFIALIDNYNCQSFKLDPTDISKLQQYFNFTKPALWHLDFARWRWSRA